MRLSLTPAQRSSLVFVSASAYVAWFAGVGQRLEAQSLAGSRFVTMQIAAASAPPSVAHAIRRDPFAGAPTETAPQAANARGRRIDASTSATDEGPPTLAADAGTPVVPNIEGATVNETAGATTLAVRATIVGRNSVAYVANGSEMDIVRVGDLLGDRRVAKIDLQGIVFTDGSRLDLPDSYNATPAPAPAKRNSITLRLDQLRALLAPVRRSAPERAVAEPAPSVAATLSYPTPGPLPTIDPTGLAPGTNPTPDLHGPTPYPIPYPYPPPKRV